MGPLIPTLFLCPVFLIAAWIFKSILWLSGAFAAAAISILIFYMWHYTRFSRSDPDRLQSEHFRYEMKRMHMIAAKDLPYPVPADELSLDAPSFNPNQDMPNAEAIEQQAEENKSRGGK